MEFFLDEKQVAKSFQRLFVSKYFKYWITMKNLEKKSRFLPYSKVKDDHPIVANCQVYWIGWVNVLSCCGH